LVVQQHLKNRLQKEPLHQEQMGSEIPTVTYYRMLRIGEDYHLGIADKGMEIVGGMLFVRHYLYERVYSHKTVRKQTALIYEAAKRLNDFHKINGKFGKQLPELQLNIKR